MKGLGYLNEDFIFFHIKDRRNVEFEPHFHDFNKIVIFLSGKVTYLIEGRTYVLKPWDMLIIGSSEVHKPLIDPKEEYDRIVIWINTNYLKRKSSKEGELLTCFDMALKRKNNLFTLNPEAVQIKNVLLQLEAACKSKEFGSSIMKETIFLQFMVYINRFVIDEGSIEHSEEFSYDKRIEEILKYINANIGEELTLDKLASHFFMNKYYIMHKFKEETGYTIHNYIVQKRLINANVLIKEGKSVIEACIQSGFYDYSSFVRAFKKQFGLSPKKYYKQYYIDRV